MTEVMTEREKEIAKVITAAIPYMPEFEKGIFLGKAEAFADMRRAERKEAEKAAKSMMV